MNLKNTFKKALSTFGFGGRFTFYGNKEIGTEGYSFGSGATSRITEGYAGNPYVFMVIDRITKRATAIDQIITDSEGAKIERPDPFFAEILNKPNIEPSRVTYERMFNNYLANELFIVAQSTLGFNDMTGFIVPNSQDVLINVDSHGNLISYDVTYLGNTKNYAPEDVLHIRRANIASSEYNGLSALEPSRKVWESDNEIWNSEASMHKNKGIAGVLYSDGNRSMTPTEHENLQKEYDSVSTGYDKFGKVRVSSSKLGYLQMGMNPNDLKSIESRIDHLRVICAVFSVDPKIFGDVAASIYNNMEQAKAGLIVDAVLPMLNTIMTELYTWISEKIKVEHYYRPDLEGVPELQVFKNELSTRLGREVMQGILPPMEARRKLYPELVTEEMIADASTSLDTSVAATATGVLAIQNAVTLGTTSRDSAVNMLITIYGFDHETAQSFLK